MIEKLEEYRTGKITLAQFVAHLDANTAREAGGGGCHSRTLDPGVLAVTWIQTYTGIAYDLQNPDPNSINIQDVAHALSQINRFTGHTREPYSVAQHSVLVAGILQEQGESTGVIRAGLLHDAHEAYIGDMSSPVKSELGQMSRDTPWGELEERHARAMQTRFWFVPCQKVKRADLIALVTEARDFLGPAPKPWGMNAEPLPLRLVPWSPSMARDAFLHCCSRFGVL